MLSFLVKPTSVIATYILHLDFISEKGLLLSISTPTSVWYCCCACPSFIAMGVGNGCHSSRAESEVAVPLFLPCPTSVNICIVIPKGSFEARYLSLPPPLWALHRPEC